MSLISGSTREFANARPMDVVLNDTNGDPITSITATITPPANAVLTSVAASVTSVSILASNANRKKFLIQNESGKVLKIAYAATATAAAYSVLISANAFYESDTDDYTGVISGIWNGTGGFARITEITV